MNPAEHQILTRISFAERWLQRAREECLDGDVGRGLLTLVLADAEVRRLLQLAAPPAPRRRPGLGPAVAVAAGVLIAAMAALQLGVLAWRAPVQSAGLTPALSLRPGTGALLAPVEVTRTEQATSPAVPARRAAPAAVRVRTPARAAAPSVVVQGQNAPARAVRARAASFAPGPSAAAPAPAGAGHPAPAPAAASVPAAVSPAAATSPSAAEDAPALSVADLLDLVIVADRTLRRSQP